MGENDNKREGGLDVEIIHIRGALPFHSFLKTGKVVEELEFKYKYHIGIKLTNLSTLRCSDL